MAIREAGDWEGWLAFYLQGVAETANEAVATAKRILSLRDEHRSLIQEKRTGVNGLKLLDILFERSLVNVNLVTSHLKVSFATANKLVEQLQRLGLLEEITRGQRNRRYRYTPFLALFEEQQSSEPSVPVQTTESEK